MRLFLPLQNTLELALRRPVRLTRMPFQIRDLRFAAGKVLRMGPDGDAVALAVSALDQPSVGLYEGGEVVAQVGAAVPPLRKRKAQLGKGREEAGLIS